MILLPQGGIPFEFKKRRKPKIKQLLDELASDSRIDETEELSIDESERQLTLQ